MPQSGPETDAAAISPADTADSGDRSGTQAGATLFGYDERSFVLRFVCVDAVGVDVHNGVVGIRRSRGANAAAWLASAARRLRVDFYIGIFLHVNFLVRLI